MPPQETEVTKGRRPVAGSVGNCTGTGSASEAPGWLVVTWGCLKGGCMCMLDGRGTARHGTARPTYQNTKTWANPILILTHNTPHTPTRLERVALADAELGGVGAPERVERAVGARERHGMVPPAGHLFLGGGDGGVGRIMITLGGWLVAGLWDKTHTHAQADPYRIFKLQAIL